MNEIEIFPFSDPEEKSIADALFSQKTNEYTPSILSLKDILGQSSSHPQLPSWNEISPSAIPSSQKASPNSLVHFPTRTLNRALALVAGLVFALLGLFTLSQFQPKSETPSQNYSAKILHIQGVVYIEVAGSPRRLLSPSATTAEILPLLGILTLEDGALVDIEAHTNAHIRSKDSGELQLLELDPTTEKVSFNLVRGKHYFTIDKLNKSSDFSVSTPHGRVEVRGTKFEVQIDKDLQEKLSVLEGKIALLPPKASSSQLGSETNPERESLATEIWIESKESMSISSQGWKKRTLEPQEILLLEKEMAPLSNTESVGSEFLPMSEEQLFQKYKNLEKIKLVNDKLIRGVVVGMDGNNLLIHSVTGKVLVLVEDISEIEKIR